jgi:hypothetical protein
LKKNPKRIPRRFRNIEFQSTKQSIFQNIKNIFIINKEARILAEEIKNKLDIVEFIEICKECEARLHIISYLSEDEKEDVIINVLKQLKEARKIIKNVKN